MGYSSVRCQPFKTITDHRNLVYYSTRRKLPEGLMRWAELLSPYTFTIHYRPGKEGTQPDVLSRREQDMPKDQEDERSTYRDTVLLEPKRVRGFPEANKIAIKPILRVRPPYPSHPGNILRAPPAPPDGPAIGDLMKTAKSEDSHLKQVAGSITRRDRSFPSNLGITVQMAECTVDEDWDVTWRERKWVPASEQLRTRIL